MCDRAHTECEPAQRVGVLRTCVRYAGFSLPDSRGRRQFRSLAERRQETSTRRWRSIASMRRLLALALVRGRDCSAHTGLPHRRLDRARCRRRTRSQRSRSKRARDEARTAKRARRAPCRREARDAPGGRRAAVAIPPQLEAIAQCESGGDPTAVSADGMYHGNVPVLDGHVGRASAATGDCRSQAPRPSRTMRAAMLYARVRPGPVARLRRLALDLRARHDVVLAGVRPADPGLVAAVVVGRP